MKVSIQYDLIYCNCTAARNISVMYEAAPSLRDLSRLYGWRFSDECEFMGVFLASTSTLCKFNSSVIWKNDCACATSTRDYGNCMKLSTASLWVMLKSSWHVYYIQSSACNERKKVNVSKQLTFSTNFCHHSVQFLCQKDRSSLLQLGSCFIISFVIVHLYKVS